MEYFAAYVLLGAFTGVIAGMLGVGGGLIIVPVLVWLFALQQLNPAIITHLAIGTSLATIIPTAMAATLAHHRHGAVRIDLLAYLMPAALLGALLGAALAEFLGGLLLRRVFGIFELLIAAYLLLNLKPPQRTAQPHPGWLSSGGAGIGTISALLGIGGGTLMVPLLSWYGVSLRHAIGTASALGLPIALGGVIGFIWHGWNNPDLPAGSSGYVLWSAFVGIALASFFTARLGAWLTHRLPIPLIRTLFAALLAVLGLKMLFF